MPNLWMGGEPPPGDALVNLGFDALILAAKECQPPTHAFPGLEVLRYPLSDDYDHIPQEDVAKIHNAVVRVMGLLNEDKKVCVTCHEGHNRSGVIVACVLMALKQLSPEEAIGQIRAVRGDEALSNQAFVSFLHHLGGAEAQTV
jgi:protein-tyrosine phosphatase